MWNKLTANTERYGAFVTNQDAWKFLALLLMVVDHIGYYFHPPQEEWFRAIGRLSAPIWFFFIGYAQPSPQRAGLAQRELWILTALMFVADVIMVQPLLPFSILLSVIMARYLMHYWVMRQNPDAMFVVVFLAKCALLMLPTMIVWEYGTAIFGFCVVGYYVKRGVAPHILAAMSIGSVGLYMLEQHILFPKIAAHQWGLVILGLASIMMMMVRVQTASPSAWMQQSTLSYIIRFFARNSLYFYVAHCLLFQTIVWMTDPPEQWKMMWLGE
jgi:hypothetical protein